MDSLSVIPAKLNEAREASGLSMRELSDLVGVSSQAISQYERGLNKPSIFVLKKIANMLDYPFEFFFKEKEVSFYSDGAVYFRAMKSTPKKIKEAYSYRIKWANEILSYLKNFIEFCKINIPVIDEYDLSYGIDSEIIEEIAEKVRNYWGLGDGPIENLTEILEDNGFILCGIAFKNRKVEAFSQWYNGVPYIFLGSNRETAVSLRFSIAHELGHLLMHNLILKKDVFNENKLNIIEKEANKFASVFLMPTKTFSKDIINNSLDYLIYVKEKWKVSLSAIIKRCLDLNLFSENQTTYLYKQINIKGYKKKEPLDDVLIAEEPELFKDAIDLLIRNKIITPGQFLKEIALPKSEIINICSLPEYYFDSKISKEKTLKIIK